MDFLCVAVFRMPGHLLTTSTCVFPGRWPPRVTCQLQQIHHTSNANPGDPSSSSKHHHGASPGLFPPEPSEPPPTLLSSTPPPEFPNPECRFSNQLQDVFVPWFQVLNLQHPLKITGFLFQPHRFAIGINCVFCARMFTFACLSPTFKLFSSITSLAIFYKSNSKKIKVCPEDKNYFKVIL